ncbi:MAG: prevent-host-death family protein [Sporichthyaceae bacterium]
MRVDTNDMLSITEANARGISKLAAEASAGRDLVLLRNNRVVAAVVGIERLEELDRLTTLREDLGLIALTLSRVATDNGNRTSLDEVMARFGLTREDLADAED